MMRSMFRVALVVLALAGGESGCGPNNQPGTGGTGTGGASGAGGTGRAGSGGVGQGGASGNAMRDAGVPSPDAPCGLRTCASENASCGRIGDGCGGLIDCGSCPAGEICGGGGPSKCGSMPDAGPCVPRTCASAAANCGPVGDGCGNVLDCGRCTAPDTCGGNGMPSQCGRPCVGLCQQQVPCMTGTTTISGTVVAPTPMQYGPPDPLYGALVYVPNAPVEPFSAGISCDRCDAQASGAPLVSATTGPDGKFRLENAPVGANIPLVIQLGRWRRQVTLPMVTMCQDNPQPAELTRLPRKKSEGDIPQFAMVTGSVDALQCLLRKVGIDDSEFTAPTAAGRVHFYRANGSKAPAASGATPADTVLYNDPAELAKHDVVILACEGSEIAKPAAGRQNLVDYTSRGGRVFATHYSYSWLYQTMPFQSTGMWDADPMLNHLPTTGGALTCSVDTSFPKGMAFEAWLRIVGAESAPGQVAINVPRNDIDGVVAPAQRWLYSTMPQTVQHYTFNTPVGVMPDQQCGRVLFSDFHVTGGATSTSTFPAECTAAPLTPQEKVLEFMLFDVSSCIRPDVPPACMPRTCAQQMLECGGAGDGCGGLLDCGMCTPPDTCGGGGTPGRCGHTTSCMPRTCAQANANCGPVADGCGNVLDCGLCTPPDTCGGGGVPSRCGHIG